MVYKCKECRRKFMSIGQRDIGRIKEHDKTKTHKANNYRFYNAEWRDTKPSDLKFHCKLCDKYITMKKDKLEGHFDTTKHQKLKKKYKDKTNIYNLNFKKYSCPICEDEVIATKDSIYRHSQTQKHIDLMKKEYFKKKFNF